MTATALTEPPPPLADRRRPAVRRAAGLVAIVALCLVCLRLGMAERAWQWEWARPIHYAGDMRNALRWGRSAATGGTLNVYANAIAAAPDGEYGLDYPPLRLLVFTAWAQWLERSHPDVAGWSSDDAMNRPLLLLNTAMEVASAALAFALVYGCRRRAGRPLAVTLGLAAAAFLWFNPQLTISTWGRPAWEVWVVPFYLAGIWLAVADEWLGSGAVLAVGMMLKGQEAIVAPVFLLWAGFAGRPANVARWAAGFAAAAAVVVAPWLLTRPVAVAGDVWPVRVVDGAAVAWVMTVAVALGGVAGWRWLRSRSVPAAGGSPRTGRPFDRLRARLRPSARHWLPPAATTGAAADAAVFWWPQARVLSLAAAAIAWPAVTPAGHALAWAIVPAAAAAVVAIRWVPRPALPAVVAAAVAATLFACVVLFHGSLDWYRVGFAYGATKFPGLEVGPASSMAGILDERYGWRHADPAWAGGPTISTVMWAAYVVALVASGYGLAHLHRRRDVRWLVAVATPWVAYFAVAPQMHERYLLWGAAAASLAVGVSPGMAVLAVVLSAVSWGDTTSILISHGDPSVLSATDADFGPALLRVLEGVHPDVGWAVLVVAAAFVYETVRPGRSATAG